MIHHNICKFHWNRRWEFLTITLNTMKYFTCQVQKKIVPFLENCFRQNGIVKLFTEYFIIVKNHSIELAETCRNSHIPSFRKNNFAVFEIQPKNYIWQIVCWYLANGRNSYSCGVYYTFVISMAFDKESFQLSKRQMFDDILT